MSFKKHLKSLLKERLYNSVSQSLVKIFETPHFAIKIYLFVCVIASSGLSSYLVIEAFIDFFSYGVTTTTRTLYENPAVFPKVTVCVQASFATQYALEFLKQVNAKVNSSIDIFDAKQMKNTSFDDKNSFINYIDDQAINFMNTLNDSEKKLLSHALEDTILLCSFNGKSCSVQDDFSWFFDPYFGNCWQFNSDLRSNLKYSTFPGINYGLSMILYVNFYENLTTFNAYTGNYLGAAIQIDNSSYLTNHYYDGIQIAPGYSTSISILDRSFKQTLPQPYSNCLIESADKTRSYSGAQSELFKLISASDYQYTSSLCYLQCTQQVLISQCNCTDASDLSLFTAQKCVTQTQAMCKSNVYENTIKTNDFIEKTCAPQCPLECYQNQIAYTMSSTELIPKIGIDYIESKSVISEDFVTKPIELETARRSFNIITVYYNSLSYTISSESPQMTVVSMLANLGGNLSLFMGVSLFSLCEIVEILVEIYFIKCTAGQKVISTRKKANSRLDFPNKIDLKKCRKNSI